MLIRPQRKAQKEQEARIAALERGNKVITNAGIHGVVERVNDRTIALKIAEGVIIELEKNAVVQVEK
jgi:preprotein translocase subunit YajC